MLEQGDEVEWSSTSLLALIAYDKLLAVILFLLLFTSPEDVAVVCNDLNTSRSLTKNSVSDAGTLVRISFSDGSILGKHCPLYLDLNKNLIRFTRSKNYLITTMHQ